MPDPHVIRAMRSAHTRHVVTCVCGKKLAGNGHKSHQRACPQHLAERGWPLALRSISHCLAYAHTASRSSFHGSGVLRSGRE